MIFTFVRWAAVGAAVVVVPAVVKLVIDHLPKCKQEIDEAVRQKAAINEDYGQLAARQFKKAVKSEYVAS